MYYIQKKMEISASHRLDLDYENKCCQMHGHNWIITVYCKSETLDKNGMIVDFADIKDKVKKKLDHTVLNDVLDFNPTAENIAYWVCSQFESCYKVEVQESQGNIAIYEVSGE
jgi:6-pyruvoyltetrahydropterin/6-carboxytetrahydropterin synthase